MRKLEGNALIWKNLMHVFFCKNTSLHRELVKAALGVREVDCFESYLGLPILIGCPKYRTFSFLKDIVWNKMHG